MSRRSAIQMLALIVFLALLLTAAVWIQANFRTDANPLPGASVPKPDPTPAPTSPYAGLIRITELMEKNKAVLPDEDGDFSDWIELANLSDETVDLSAWRICDRPDRAGWTFPALRLAPGERVVIFASRKNRVTLPLHTDFALSEADTVALYDADGLAVDSVPCGGCEGDVSMALTADGAWQPSLTPTPGFANTRAGYEAYSQTLRVEGPLVINEVMVSNRDAFWLALRWDLDWVELKNVSDAPVLLSDYWLSDQEDDPARYRLPEVTLQPGALYVLLCDADSPARLNGWDNTGFSLNAACEQLYLTAHDGTRVDFVSLRGIPYNGSYGRRSGENGFFYFDTPTPEQANRGGARTLAETPVNLTPDGVYEGVDAVTLTLGGEGTIRYTLDGSLPGAESPVYTGALTLTGSCVVRAVSFVDGCLPSLPLNLCFLINEGHSLPVVSLVTDTPREFGYMYDSGHRGVEMTGALNFYRGEERFSIGCCVSMNGETSLSENKKNMSLRFRAALGSETLEYDLYGGGATSFTNLLLRAGQDQDQAIIRNELAQALAERVNARVINQRSLWCALYINGEYRGLYTLKEKANEALYASYYGIDRDSVELVEAPAAYGSDFYETVIRPASTGELLTEEGYARFCRAVDVDSLIDWLIMEGFCSNTDVTMGNVRYARSMEYDGRWRFLFYDLDAAFRFTGSMYYNLMSEYSARNIQISVPVRELMKNPAFRERFLTRAHDLLRDELTNTAVLEEIDRLAAEIRPEVERDRARLGRSASNWERSLENLRELIRYYDWRQANIDAICDVFGLKGETRAAWFGDIDAQPS